MGMTNKVSNKLQDLRGKGKEAVGSVLGHRDLESKGKADQAKAAVKDAGEHLKDRAKTVRDAVKGD